MVIYDKTKPSGNIGEINSNITNSEHDNIYDKFMERVNNHSDAKANIESQEDILRTNAVITEIARNDEGIVISLENTWFPQKTITVLAIGEIEDYPIGTNVELTIKKIHSRT